MPNQLAHETSPYLLQHQHNPVDWYPWGPEALHRARREDKPIFLSIGYSACHWCHVMERESFEDSALARKLNEHFVCIKVDREERPDLDQIYMNAVLALTGHGGWPMSVFLTPNQKPFYGGTYWPPASRGGMPGFGQVLQAVADAWGQRREQVLQGAAQLTERVREASTLQSEPGQLSVELLAEAADKLGRVFDPQFGGFGQAPKFPHSLDLQVLLRQHKRKPNERLVEMVGLSLDGMAAGGIYDHLGGGFARYSVDARWLVPHFEKMLYDNALLASAYLEGFLVTRDPRYRQVVQETLDYVLRDMTDLAGGFYSAEDADSEGEEGKFYIWTPSETLAVLGAERAERFNYVYDVTAAGNFEGKNILHLPKTISQCAQVLRADPGELAEEMAACRQELLQARQNRVRPGRDDKVLVSWNGLAIDALALAAGALAEPRFLAAAEKAADFLLKQVRSPDGRLLHSWRQGTAKLDAYLDDYAALANALVSLYETGGQERWIDEAVWLVDELLARFEDQERGGFYYTAADHEPLLARVKDFRDSSIPSGNALAALVLTRLGLLCGREDYLRSAQRTLEGAVSLVRQWPTSGGQSLIALDLYLGPTPEIVLLGHADHPGTIAVRADLAGRFIPSKVVAFRAADAHYQSAFLEPLVAGKSWGTPEPTVYICQNFACQAPLQGMEAALTEWAKMAAANPTAKDNSSADAIV